MSTPRFSADAAEWVPPSVRSGASHENGGPMKFTPDELRRARTQSLSLQYFRDMSRWLEAVHGEDAVYLRVRVLLKLPQCSVVCHCCYLR